ncbi:MAG: DUF3052 domain-containing protein [Mobiluncus sp.]|uniref:DUF3052 domain-containing protein n=1 Tax=Mobiluncus sp. TaxID=47293 RepID=UPI00258EF485|nr:DUF3052 domain-containing protein [Mobiluncus sp.]MCI6584502.1 DUF3052 domain-containing protein [Mobiluncus sp.]
MTNTDSAAKAQSPHKDHGNESLGFQSGQIIQEFYYDDDADENLRQIIEKAIASELVDEDYGDVSDGAIIWWRAEDGEVDDLADLLVDASGNLDNGGLIWVFVPKAGSKNSVDTQFVEEATQTAGLRVMSSSHVSPDWLGIRLLARASER